MKCPNHITKDVAGYCSVCGSFVCVECLSHHEGNAYCPKHFKPIAAKLEREGGSGRPGRQHLMVHFLDGTKAQGSCRSMNLNGMGYFLEEEDDAGISLDNSLRVQFADTRYVANVKSYTGEFDRHDRHQEYNPGGSHIIVRLEDGKVIEGTTMHAYVPDHPRFYLIPHDPHSNYINLLIEQPAVDRVFTADEYRAEMKREKELKKERKKAAAAAGAGEGDLAAAEESSVLSQEESMGDFYFGTHNYPAALEQYQPAMAVSPGSHRLRRKTAVTLINIGIHYIKSREYPASLEYMERALELEPKNPHAKKKAKQLKKIIGKTERRMREYYEQQASGGGDAGDDMGSL